MVKRNGAYSDRAESDVRFVFSPYMGLVPLGVFVVGALYLGLSGTPDERGFWPIVILAQVVGLLLAKNRNAFSVSVIEGMAQSVVAVMIASWLLAGAVGELVRQSGLVESLVNVFVENHLPKGVFLLGAFFISGIIGTSTGTAVGTVLITAPVLYPAGLAIGCDAYWILGAVLGGGAFGDDFSPISDTTIASAQTQGVDISRSVRSRVKYAMVAAAIASVAYCFAGTSGGDGVILSSTLDGSEVGVGSWQVFLMALGPVLVVTLCLRGVHLVTALLSGIAAMAALGILVGVYEPSQLFSLDKEHFRATSIVTTGMDRAVGITVFSVLLVGLIKPVLESGVIDGILNAKSVDAGLRKFAEPVIVGVTIVLNTALAHNTVTIIALGDVVRRAGEKYGVPPLRRANLLDLAGNTVMHMFPYMITVILAIGVASQFEAMGGPRLSPWLVGFHNAHSLALLVLVLLASLTGMWRNRDV